MVCFFLLDNVFLLNPSSKLLIILLFSCYFLLHSWRPSLVRSWTVLRVLEGKINRKWKKKRER